MVQTIVVTDNLQPGYQYDITSPTGTDYADGFAPELTPQQMLEMGVFGGNYFGGDYDEYPAAWFVHARLADHHDVSLNYFEVDASQSRDEWERKGWIHPQDPRGWFQWYCRYYMGRRSSDDERQIQRWRQMKRHIGQIRTHCAPGDQLCRRKQRQALLHWAYDSTKL